MKFIFLMILPLILSCTSLPLRTPEPQKLAYTSSETSALEEFQGALSCRHSGTSFKCAKFISNSNANTIRVNLPGIHPLFGENAEVRINAIVTPRVNTKSKCEKKKAIEAREFVRAALSGADRVDLERVSKGKYFRIVADVKYFIHGKVFDLKKELLERKMAVSYNGGVKSKVDWCR